MRLNERKTKKKGLSEKERERVIKRKGEILEKEVGEGRKSRGDKIKRRSTYKQSKVDIKFYNIICSFCNFGVLFTALNLFNITFTLIHNNHTKYNAL